MSKKPAVPDPVPASDQFLLDIPTTAKRMSTTVYAVRELCRKGRLKYVALGHKWLISAAAIQAFIRQNEEAA